MTVRGTSRATTAAATLTLIVR